MLGTLTLVTVGAGAGKLTVVLVTSFITPDVNPSRALLTAVVFVAPRPVNVATPEIAVAVVVPVRLHEPASFLATVTTVELLELHIFP